MPSLAPTLCIFLLIFTPCFTLCQSTVDPKFDFESWKKTIGRHLEEKGIQEDSQMRFVIDVGLGSIPELQQIMKDRHQRFVAGSGGREWSLRDFLEDLSVIHECVPLQRITLTQCVSVHSIPTHPVPNLDARIKTVKTRTESRSTLWKFSIEHPWITASLVVFGVIIVISPYPYLAALRLLGFRVSGPVARSWAASFQSRNYGGRTKGLFSVLQNMAMTGTVNWSVSVFTGIAVGVGAVMAYWGGAVVVRFVESLLKQGRAPFPGDETLIAEEWRVWMTVLGKRMEKMGVPNGQWFDVVIELLRPLPVTDYN
ncbi:hypothetical protein L218DRAFT_1008374 [Marasmius fiardii PR-910]|nr:hypothetical protein L218DRAFT_1008374 [Marasmius fiardii PR-910]